jgi:hypothetical protein
LLEKARRWVRGELGAGKLMGMILKAMRKTRQDEGEDLGAPERKR